MAVRDKPEETKWVTAESRPYRIVRPVLSKNADLDVDPGIALCFSQAAGYYLCLNASI